MIAMVQQTTVPNLLTITRILLVPVVVGLFFLDSPLGNWLATLIFILACITDYLDGYFARTLKQTSNLGVFLDPMADKLLVAATILMLVGMDRVEGIHLIAAVVILCRELLVSGLREYLADVRVTVPVSQLAKWKTTIQMIALSFLIIGDTPLIPLPIHTIGLGGLWVAAVLTLITGFDYLRTSYKHI